MADDFIFYEDALMTKRIKELDFGRPFLGQLVEKTIYISNPSIWPCREINCINREEELKIEYPTELNGKETKPVKLKLLGSLERDEPLTLDKLFMGKKYIG